MDSTYTVNADRGEVPIVLDGKVYPMRPSRNALKAIEARTGSSIESLLHRVDRTGGLTLTEREIIVTEGIRAAGKERNDPMLMSVGEDTVGEKMFDAGYMTFSDVIARFVVNGIAGGVDSTKKADPGSAAPGEGTSGSGATAS